MSRRVLRDVPIKSVKVGKRARQDLGNLEALAESIQALTLLQPILITKERRLLAGHRRLEACRFLGHSDIAAIELSDFDDAVSQLRIERDENTCRKDMAPSEKAALGVELERLEKPKAQERRSRTRKRGTELPVKENFLNGKKGQTRDIVGKELGWSGRTYAEAKALVQAANDPEESESIREVAREGVAEMDKTGKVSPAYRKLAEARKPDLAPKHRPSTATKRPKAGKRTVKQAVASLRQAAINVDSAVAGFDMGSFGDLKELVNRDEAEEWFAMLSDASRRLVGHVRTIRSYQHEGGRDDGQANQPTELYS